MVSIVNEKNYVNKEKGTVVVFITDSFNNKFKGKSKCNPEDKFDEKFGEKLAYLRAKRNMVKYYYKANLENLKFTRKSMEDYEERMAKELGKHENVLNKTIEAIDKMLNNEV